MGLTPEPSKAALAFYWILLAVGAAGLSFFVCVCITDSSALPSIGAFWWTWPISCAAVVLYGGWRLVAAARRQVHPGRPQLYVSDLLIVSLLLALFLAIVRPLAPENFYLHGVFGGAAVTAAMVLALLNASRRGYTGGAPRGLYAAGSVLTVFGLGGVGLLLFFCIIVPVSEAPRMGLSQAAEELVDVLFSSGSRWHSVGISGIAGAIALVIGRGLCMLARKSQQSRETPSDPAIK